MVWGPTNLSPESCSISNHKRLGDCGLVSPPTDRRCNQMADNAKCHSRHLTLIFIFRLLFSIRISWSIGISFIVIVANVCQSVINYM